MVAFIASAASLVAAYSGVPFSGVSPAIASVIACLVWPSGATSTHSRVMVVGVRMSVVKVHKPHLVGVHQLFQGGRGSGLGQLQFGLATVSGVRRHRTGDVHHQ